LILVQVSRAASATPIAAIDNQWHRSYKIAGGRCHGPCKILDPNRTKTFHVKHFGKVFGRDRSKLTFHLFAVKNLDLGAHSVRQGAKFWLWESARKGIIGPLLTPGDRG
jgi:hypothetical protein